MKYPGKALALAIISPACLAQEAPEKRAGSVNWHVAALTVQVKNEDGQPIPGADVRLGFANLAEYNDGFNDFRGKTDARGLFHGESNLTGEVRVEVSMAGYYPSRLDYIFTKANNLDAKPGDKVLPWNPTRPVMLKKKGNPVPMIVQGIYRYCTAPGLEMDYGFDMMLYDWISPHGKGKTADLWIRFLPDVANPANPGAKARLRFSNPEDGMIAVTDLVGGESELKFPRIAPENGYNLKALEVVADIGEDPPEPDTKLPAGYLFRIRTLKDPETGAILSATYGKIMDTTGNEFREPPIQVAAGFEKEDPPAGDLKVTFSYDSYINPTANDRNLEFDTKTNLAPGMEDGYRAP